MESPENRLKGLLKQTALNAFRSVSAAPVDISVDVPNLRPVDSLAVYQEEEILPLFIETCIIRIRSTLFGTKQFRFPVSDREIFRDRRALDEYCNLVFRWVQHEVLQHQNRNKAYNQVELESKITERLYNYYRRQALTRCGFSVNSHISDDGDVLYIAVYVYPRGRERIEYHRGRSFDEFSVSIAYRIDSSMRVGEDDIRFLSDELLYKIEAHFGNMGYGYDYEDYGWRPPLQQMWQMEVPKVSKEKTEATKRAEELLLSQCTKKQIDDWEQHGFFIVTGGDTGTQYKLYPKKEINIEVMLNGKPIHRLCTTPDRHSFNVPIEDQLLAQKTLIELREKAFLEVARKWPITSFI